MIKFTTQIVNNRSVTELVPIMESRTNKVSTIFTDSFKNYDELVDYCYKQHYRIKHNEIFADGRNQTTE